MSDQVGDLLARAVSVIGNIEHLRKEAAQMSTTAGLMGEVSGAEQISAMARKKLEQADEACEELFDLVRKARKASRE